MFMLSYVPSPLAVPRSIASYVLPGGNAAPEGERIEEEGVGPMVAVVDEPVAPPPVPELASSDLHNAAFLLGKAAELAALDQADVAEEYYQAALAGVLRAARDSNGDIGDRASRHLVKALVEARAPVTEADNAVEDEIVVIAKEEEEIVVDGIQVKNQSLPPDETAMVIRPMEGALSITSPLAPSHPSSALALTTLPRDKEETTLSHTYSPTARMAASLAIRALDLAISVGVYIARTRVADDISRHLLRRWDDLDEEYHLSDSFMSVAAEVVKRAQDGKEEGKAPVPKVTRDDSSITSHFWSKRPWSGDYTIKRDPSSAEI